MTDHRKRRGAEAERCVAAFLRDAGWPFAEAVGAGRGGTDVTGTPGLVWEVKARREVSMRSAMVQAAGHGTEHDLPVLVLRLNGQGPASVSEWPAVLPLAALVSLLREAGYGG